MDSITAQFLGVEDKVHGPTHFVRMSRILTAAVQYTFVTSVYITDLHSSYLASFGFSTHIRATVVIITESERLYRFCNYMYQFTFTCRIRHLFSPVIIADGLATLLRFREASNSISARRLMSWGCPRFILVLAGNSWRVYPIKPRALPFISFPIRESYHSALRDLRWCGNSVIM
jgi:hypothetical protein